MQIYKIMDIQTPVPDFLTIGKMLVDDTRRFARVYCLNFFKDSFHRQGFTDTTFQAWDKRVQPDYRPGGALLVSSSFLLESLRVVSGNKYQIVFGTYASYAKIHNEGGTLTVPITPKSRKYFWYMYKKTKDDKWKWMALSKKKYMKITFPKRQFIGDSKVMMDGLQNWVIQQIETRFKNLK